MGEDLQSFDTGTGKFMALLGSVLFESKIEDEAEAAALPDKTAHGVAKFIYSVVRLNVQGMQVQFKMLH